MNEFLSVNEALDRRAALNGAGVEIEGILEVQPEGYSLLHFPKSARRPDLLEGNSNFRPEFWLNFGSGSISPNHQKLAQWAGKRVRVHGVLILELFRRHDGQVVNSGSGPCCVMAAALEPYSIQRVTSEQRRAADGA